ncbi:MAG: glucose-6-phosphate dehydrogenase [Thermodesulfobacteriota bacterium]
MAEEQGNATPATVQGQALDADWAGASCLLPGALEPCLLVIVGASGDLTGRKLIPALYNLFLHGGLPEPGAIVGAARTEWDDDAFRGQMRAAVAEKGGLDMARWDQFAARLYYQPLTYDDPHSYHQLAQRLDKLDRRLGTRGNRIFNLAIPPTLYAQVALHLGRAGLAAEGQVGKNWVRLVVEKPFGHDLASARQLQTAVGRFFREHQVYRIDHYLAKETVQNVLMLRFANAIFEPLWNRNYIDHVSIVSTETLGVEHRAGYYERAGVLRDMFQNHMLQLMSMVAMEPPSLFFADRVRDEKTKSFRSLRPFPLEEMDDHLVLGQYGAGAIDGRPAAAYRDEPGVDPGSLTPTFALMRVYLDNWRWQGVPFVLVSGKRLAKKLTRMVIHFKEVPHSLFRQVLGPHISANRLILGVHPDESISLTFQSKNPGARLCLRSVNMFFDFNRDYAGPRLEAYEKALIDCMLGDQMLFWRQDGIELTWAWLDELIHQCETCNNRAGRLKAYPAGSWGPPETARVLAGLPAPWA